jgi:hypothetical protein
VTYPRRPQPQRRRHGPLVGTTSSAAVGIAPGPFGPTSPGTYNFVATYSGDADYAPVTTPGGPARLAGIMLLVGMMLVAATRFFGEGPGLAFVPAGRGPRGPRGPGSGGSPFGGTRIRPPRPPSGGGSAGVLGPPPAAPAEPAWDRWVGSSEPAPAAEPAPVVGEVLLPTVVTFRATGGLDAAALDAAQALETPAPLPGGRAHRRPGRS